jgi:hypothetical protein
MSQGKDKLASKSFFRDNLVAIGALFVSGLSLWFAIDAQKTDREYKELAIVPHMSDSRFATELSVFFRNSGIGPALIKQIKYYTAKSCSDSASMAAKDWAAQHLQIEFQSVSDFLDDAFSVQPDNVLKDSTINISALQPANVYSVGEKLTFFQVLEARDIFKKMGENRSSRVLGRFAMLDLPFSFEYCSLTGKSCFKFNTEYIDAKCSKLKSKP